MEMYVNRVYNNTIQSSQATGQRTLMVADDDDGLATLTSMVIVKKKKKWIIKNKIKILPYL